MRRVPPWYKFRWMYLVTCIDPVRSPYLRLYPFLKLRICSCFLWFIVIHMNSLCLLMPTTCFQSSLNRHLRNLQDQISLRKRKLSHAVVDRMERDTNVLFESLDMHYMAVYCNCAARPFRVNLFPCSAIMSTIRVDKNEIFTVDICVAGRFKHNWQQFE